MKNNWFTCRLIFQFNFYFSIYRQVRGDKDADGFYWGEVAGRSGYVPCNMVSEVQVDDERVAQELLKVGHSDYSFGHFVFCDFSSIIYFEFRFL